MTVTEKAMLASRYLHTFLTHARINLVIGIILMIAGVYIVFKTKTPHFTKRVGLGYFISLIGVLVFVAIGGVMENPFIPNRDLSAHNDFLIIRYSHRLPYYRDIEKTDAKKLKHHISPINKYGIEKQGYQAKRKYNMMKAYIDNYQPKRPWLDFRF